MHSNSMVSIHATLPNWATSIMREAVQNSKPVTGMSASFVPEGDEDYSTPFPNSTLMAERLVNSLEKIVTIEALIGSFALERRLQSGQLTEKDIPEPLRTLQREIIKRSPMQIPVDAQYSLAPLLKYFIEEYQPPQEILSRVVRSFKAATDLPARRYETRRPW